MKTHVTSGLVIAALRRLYDSRDYAFLEQVRGRTGAQGSRYADGMAFSLFPSRGLNIEGFEVKVSRTDWLNELKQPPKADEIFQFCDHWWLAVGADGIVRDNELPEPWGLMVLREGVMVVEKQAPRLQPITPTKGFIASVMRNVSRERPGKEELEQQRLLGYEEGVKSGKESAKRSAEYDTKHAARVEQMVKQFEDASGVQIFEWNAGKVGAALKTLLNGTTEVERARERIQSAERQLRAAHQSVSDHLKQLDSELGSVTR